MSVEREIDIKEETRRGVISALKQLANRHTANDIHDIIKFVEQLNLNNDEQWGVLDRLADKEVAFKRSGDISDLQ